MCLATRRQRYRMKTPPKKTTTTKNKKQKQNKKKLIFFHELAIFWLAEKRCKDTHFSILHHLSPVIFANATVMAFLLLRSSWFNFHCYTQRDQRLLRNRPGSGSYDLSRLLARKITKGIHSCKPASLNHPIGRQLGSDNVSMSAYGIR